MCSQVTVTVRGMCGVSPEEGKKGHGGKETIYFLNQLK